MSDLLGRDCGGGSVRFSPRAGLPPCLACVGGAGISLEAMLGLIHPTYVACVYALVLTSLALSIWGSPHVFPNTYHPESLFARRH